MRIHRSLLAAVLLAVAGASNASPVFSATYADEGNQIISFVVPTTGIYDITAAGAGGGTGGAVGYAQHPGGVGASVEGLFSLEAGQVLQILIGQRGSDYSDQEGCGGGGGGTFVVISNTGFPDTPLIIAGGGGGRTVGNDFINYANADAGKASLLESGGPSGGGLSSGGAGGAGGGGFTGDGANGASGKGGHAFEDALNPGAGGAGGAISVRHSIAGNGGFGGGGGGAALDNGGGGGGGYSGGDEPANGFSGNAGTSYYNPDYLVGATPTISPAGLTAADGSLTIDLQPVPEPTSALGSSALLAGFSLKRSRRRGAITS